MGLLPGGSSESVPSRVCVADFERDALAKLSRDTLCYYASGACSEETLNNNTASFSKLRIKPRILRDVSKRSVKCKILGQEISAPIGVAPTAMQKLVHPQGECATAAAAATFGSIFTLSTLSTTSIEEVGDSNPGLIKWYQLYVYKDRDVTKGLVERAERAGFKALVLTVDTSVFGLRYRDMRNKFSLPSHLTLANFSGLFSNMKQSGVPDLLAYVNKLFDDSLSWDDVTWLKSITSLPIILKGILTAEDAEIAVNLGVSGIIVSNHGGRQLDTCPSTIEALPEVSRAVGGRCEVYLDGGIRHGTDIFKALALGAKMVFIGRPSIYGLTCDGQTGVRKVLDILKAEFETALALAGCRNVDEIRSEMVVHESVYAKL